MYSITLYTSIRGSNSVINVLKNTFGLSKLSLVETCIVLFYRGCIILRFCQIMEYDSYL